MPQHKISLRRSFLLALGWALTAIVLNPLTYGMWSAAAIITSGDPSWRQDPSTLPIEIFGMSAYVLMPTIYIYGVLILPILTVWALIARTHRKLDSAEAVVLGTLAIAAFAGSMRLLSRSQDPRPLAPHGLVLLPDAIGSGVLVWIALLLPRLVIPQLGIGKFGGIS